MVGTQARGQGGSCGVEMFEKYLLIMLISSNLLPIMVLPLVLVFAGTAFQTSKGLGLALIAWPGLLLVMDSVVAV